MPKKIIFAADGTWQLPRNNTNVYKLYKGLSLTSSQVAFYDDGLGAEASGFTRALDGILGRGILDKVMSGYGQISHVYEPGDEVFLFGFSRGAYTARSVAGMIAACGLPAGDFDDALVEGVFAAYRDKANRAQLLAQLAKYKLETACIRMIGVWDTVGALGVPAIFGGMDADKYGFLDTSLNPNVKNAFQCMSIDERRREFPITQWTSAPAPGQTIEQVWFSGCHGDIGGGTTAAGGVDDLTTLSDAPLTWMVAKAAALGLAFEPAFLAKSKMPPAKYALDKLHESWLPLFGLPVWRPVEPGSAISNSVAVRLEYAITYAPQNLNLQDGKLDPSYTIVKTVDEDVI
jgi:uncharacterized protein (DUF2235 family)